MIIKHSSLPLPNDGSNELIKDFTIASQGYTGHESINATLMLGIGESNILVFIKNGVIDAIKNTLELRPLASWDFSITADVDAWNDFWQPMPKAGCHDVFALIRNNRMKIEGNILQLMQHLQFYKDLLATVRKS